VGVHAARDEPLADAQAALPHGELERRGPVVRRDVGGGAGRVHQPCAHVQVAVARSPVLRGAGAGAAGVVASGTAVARWGARWR
jgi:hypothetical protein